jgi:hypothetical protein
MFSLPRMRTPESVTVHECGHQFWYGLVGNNEFEAGWLDEGFNTFSQTEAMWLRYGYNPATTDYGPFPIEAVRQLGPAGGGLADWFALRTGPQLLGANWAPLHASGLLDFWRDQPCASFARQRDDPRSGDRNGYLADPETDPIDRPGWLYADSNSYRTNSYRRTATMLRTLEGLVGAEKFEQGMRLYSERWRYRHPYADDFFNSFQEGAGVDIGWFFEDGFRSHATIDWSVEVDQKPAPADEGWFLEPDGTWKRKESTQPKEGANGWLPQLVLRRKGEFCLPITLELGWEGGEKETLIWTREQQLRQAWWKPLAERGACPKKLESAVLDPTQRYWLDRDLTNNRWYAAHDERTSVRWAERVLAQAAAALHWFGGIGG